MCAKCRLPLFVNEFSINKSKKDGRNSTCRKCARDYSKQHYKNNKKYYKAKARRNSNAAYQANLDRVNACELPLPQGEGLPI